MRYLRNRCGLTSVSMAFWPLGLVKSYFWLSKVSRVVSGTPACAGRFESDSVYSVRRSVMERRYSSV